MPWINKVLFDRNIHTVGRKEIESKIWELENKTLWQRFHCKARQFVNGKVLSTYMIIPVLKDILKRIGTLFVKFMNNPFKDPLTDLEDEMLYNCESYCGQPCNVTRISTIYYEVIWYSMITRKQWKTTLWQYWNVFDVLTKQMILLHSHFSKL